MVELTPVATPGLIVDALTPAPLPGAVWLTAHEAGEGFSYDFEAGALAGAKWLTVDGLTLRKGDLALVIELHEAENPKPFVCRFTLLPCAQARLRLDLAAVNLNRWRYLREGACLKPTVSGGRVELRCVNRIVLKVLYKGPETARWCMTPLRAAVEEPEVLRTPLLPQGPLLDALGQATWLQWSGKTATAEELGARLRAQLGQATVARAADGLSDWGGWTERNVGGSGFFRTHHDGRRWWLVDPSGCLFWSVGPSSARPNIDSNVRHLGAALAWTPPRDGDYAAARGPDTEESERIDFLVTNLIRVFGADAWKENWERLIYPLMREIGFNTCGNWSDCAAARRAHMPYVLPMTPAPEDKRAGRVFRDFPDVFAPAFTDEAAAFAAQLGDTRGDAAMIGYFLMNEPLWAFTDLFPAEGMLWNAPRCATREAFAAFLLARHGTDEGLARAWRLPVTAEDVAGGEWTRRLTAEALADAEAFSIEMARKLYRLLGAACREADKNHLNLGARFSSAPKPWVAAAMTGCFDVFSINCYKTEADPRLEEVCRMLGVPALIGEWHFGALDAGLPAPGIGHVATQADRGRMYRCYVEASAARPWCVGAHWFTLYDQSALGRGDGENYNIGFLDVCHRVYEPLADAARVTHGRLFAVAAGALAPYADQPLIVERLNM